MGTRRKLLWPPLWGILTDVIWTAIPYLLRFKQGTWPEFRADVINNLPYGFAGALISFVLLSWDELLSWRGALVSSCYRGFYRFLPQTGMADNLLDIEEAITSATGRKSRLRPVVLEYVMRSMEELGQNGFAVADAVVDSYVGFISDLVRNSDHVSTTCIVRPYWFVVDEIQGVALPPFVNGDAKFGKGEHLRCFEAGKLDVVRDQRCLIVDELMLAEVLVSALIDLAGTNLSARDCPFCYAPANRQRCPFHSDRSKFAGNVPRISDVPEIAWFAEEVNRKRGVNLIYTFVSSAWRASCEELQDRVFASSKELALDLRFNFTSLERGIMRLHWADRARPLATIKRFTIKIDAETGADSEANGHKFYQTFATCIEHKTANSLLHRHLESLSDNVEEHFTPVNVAAIASTERQTLQTYLCSGSAKMKELIIKCISDLSAELKSDPSISATYRRLVDKYGALGSESRIAYVVTLDTGQPLQPVRVAQWDKNWKGILSAQG